MAKDVKEVARLSDVSVQPTDIPSMASITFPNPENELIPSKFLITVPRFYPHSAPAVQCLDHSALPYSSYLDENGYVVHRIISDWKAIYSITAIIQSLKEVREAYSYGIKDGAAGSAFTDEDDTSSVMDEV